MLNDITVLMTGAGAPGAPGILRCYKNNGERNIRIIGVDIKDRHRQPLSPHRHELSDNQ